MSFDTGTETLLVPIDLSETSERVILGAARLAHKLSASMLVLHVVHESTKGASYPRDLVGCSSSTRLEDIAALMLKKLVDDMRERYPLLLALRSVRTQLVSGLPGNRICEVAERENALMIVMGTRRRRKLRDLLSGSAVEQVNRSAGVPVTHIKIQESAEARKPAPNRESIEAEPQLFV